MAVGATPALQTPQRQFRALPLRQRIRHPLYWSWVRFVAFGRAVPAVLFGYMGWLQVGHVRSDAAWASAHPNLSAVAGGLLPGCLYLLFCSIPVGLYLTRPMPQARDGRLVARAAAFTGTLMQLLVGVLVPAGREVAVVPAAVRSAGTPLALFAFSVAIYAMSHLRRNLSIIPEARKLTTTGPYRLGRHPLYFAEILAAVALVLSAPYSTLLVALGVFIVMQNVRASFEERLLRATFSEYAAYAKRTRRLIPFVW